MVYNVHIFSKPLDSEGAIRIIKDYKMNIEIRNEEPNNYRSVEEVARESFWNLYFPGGHEHYVVHKMRSHADFIKELAFVIEVEDEIVGAI